MSLFEAKTQTKENRNQFACPFLYCDSLGFFNIFSYKLFEIQNCLGGIQSRKRSLRKIKKGLTRKGRSTEEIAEAC